MKTRARLSIISVLTVIQLVFVVTLHVAALRAKSQSSPSTAVAPAFEVASVKRNVSADIGFGISGPAPGGFTTRHAPLDRIIRYAFGQRDDQLLGVPAWARTERFDIIAKYPDGPRPNFQQVALMVQALLVERFNLKTHKETREGAIYALVLARRDGRLGPKLRPTAIDCAAYFAEKRAAGEVVRFNGRGDAPPCMGVSSNRFIKGNVRPIAMLLSAIAGQVGRPVIDRTGLTGNFEFNLEWSPDLSAATPPTDASRVPPPDDSVSLFTALEEQLGLKLEAARGAVDMLVIDNVEHPTEN